MPNSSTVASVSSAATSLPLLSNEQIIFRARPHFIIPFSFILAIWAVGTLFLWLLIKFEIINFIPQISPLIIEIIYISAFVFVGLIIFLSWLKTEYILTSKRVEWRFGIIGQSVLSIALGHIENILLSISIIGRIFNFGNIKIEPAGLTSSIKFNGIADPQKHKEQIEEAAA